MCIHPIYIHTLPICYHVPPYIQDVAPRERSAYRAGCGADDARRNMSSVKTYCRIDWKNRGRPASRAEAQWLRARSGPARNSRAESLCASPPPDGSMRAGVEADVR